MERTCVSPDERAQSEIIGTVLFVGVVVVTVTAFGAGLLGSVQEDDDPLGDVSGEVSSDEIRLTHRGGDSLAVADLEVVVRIDGATTRVPFDDGTLSGSNPDRFDPGETWTRSASFAEDEEVRVYLVHGPTGSVLFEGRKIAEVTTTAPTPTTTPPATTSAETTTSSPTTTTTPTATTTTAETTTTAPTVTTTTAETTTITTTETTTTVAPNEPPTATFTVTCDGLTCEFDAGSSTDADGSVESFEWDFGDGASATGVTATHTYEDWGTETVTLTVTDDDGATDTESVSVTVAPPQPQLSAVAVTDWAENDDSDYRVAYDVTNREEFDHVTVEFDNRQVDWADATDSNDSARGYVGYQQAGVGGDTYDITVRVYNDSGGMTDARAITDVADGTDPDTGDDLSRESSPTFAGTVVDDVSASQADYEASYNVTNQTNFSHVRVRVDNLDSGASATYTSADSRTNVDDYAEADYGGTFGDSYRVTMQVVDDAGIVVDERVVTDTADGTDPDGNADLSRASSPGLLQSSISDKSKSNQGAWFDVQYEATDNGEFDRVEVQFRNLDSRDASQTMSGGARGRLTHRPGTGYGDRYVIEIRVIDADGIVVAERVVTDTADGTDP